MIDYELVLAEKQDFKAAVTTKAVDLGQKTPNIGLHCGLSSFRLPCRPARVP